MHIQYEQIFSHQIIGPDQKYIRVHERIWFTWLFCCLKNCWEYCCTVQYNTILLPTPTFLAELLSSIGFKYRPLLLIKATVILGLKENELITLCLRKFMPGFESSTDSATIEPFAMHQLFPFFVHPHYKILSHYQIM